MKEGMLSDSFVTESEISLPHGGAVAWWVCLSAGLFFFYEFFQLNLFDVINQSLRSEFHADAARLSWMSSTFLWANILFLLPAGFLLDRYSTRYVILSSLSVCVVGTFGFALTHSFMAAAFFHFLSGIGNAFCFLSCVVLVSRWFPPHRQALVIGSIVTMAFLGGMVAHLPLAQLMEAYGWRRALLMDAGFGVFIFLWIFLSVLDYPKGYVLHATDGVDAAPSLRQVLHCRLNWLAGLYTSCLNLPILVICALWGAGYLQVVHQLSPMSASGTVSFILLGSMVGCPLVGFLSDCSGRRKPWMILGAVATFIISLPLWTGVALSQTMLRVLFFTLGLFSSTQVITYPLIAESNRSSNTGMATGIASVIIMGGGAVGQVLFGWLMHHHAGVATATYAIADFQFAMGMFPVAAVIALLAILSIKKT